MSPHVVLFDLDGTLSDSAEGILGSLRAALADHGLPPLDPATERLMLGPPLYDSLPPIIGTTDLAGVIASYREHYERGGGMFRSRLYDGVPELLESLRERELVLAVATSKREAQAVPIAEWLGIATYFTVVCGDTLDGARRTKALVVGEALRRLGAPDPADVLMVGDRFHDVLGAQAHGIACLGAGWGYGTDAELLEVGVRAIYRTPAALGTALLDT